MKPIDWSLMKTKEQVEDEKASSEYLILSRKSGLFWIYDNLGVTEDQILGIIDLIEDEGERYKAKLSFNTNYWHSNDPYVISLGKSLGLVTHKQLKEAFQEAEKL